MKVPTYEIFIDGKPRKVELTKTGEFSFTIKVDEKTVKAELSAEKPNLEKAFSINVDGKIFQIGLPKIDRDKPFAVKVEEATFKAEVKTPINKSALATFAPVAPSPAKRAVSTKQVVEGAIVAPMTGRILSVKVKKGDQVETGQVLCILEAMKMENEITASKAGTVREVYAVEGSSVSEGEALFTID